MALEQLDLLIEKIQNLIDRVRHLEEQETPFEAGLLPPSAGGTGVDNGTATLTLAASIALSGSGASSGKILRHDGSRFVPSTLAAGDLPSHTHAAGDITSGTFSTSLIPNLPASQITSGVMAAARLGSGSPSASTLLFGDSTWATLAVADIPSLPASQITSGIMAAARLGSGSPSASTLLFGDSTWATLAASDIPNLDASKITTGTLPITRGGTGATSASAALSNLGGVGGSAASGQVAFWNASSTLAGDANFTYNSSTNQLVVGGTVVANALSTSGLMYAAGGIQTGGQTWTLGTYTATVSTIIGYVTVTVNGTTRKLAVVS